MSRHIESAIQQTCVTWFRLQYPLFAKMLFAVPNGGSRNKIEAAIMKGEGVTTGVSDMILLLSRKGYTSLCVEMKAGKGDQSDNQKEWQEMAEKNGSKYAICRSLDEFIELVNDYLN